MVQPPKIYERDLSMDSVTIGYAEQHTKKLGTSDFWKGVFKMASTMAAGNLDLRYKNS